MTALVKTNAPAQTAPGAAFLPPQKGLSNEQQGFGSERGRCQPQTSLSAAPPLIQTKVTIGEPDDEYEREADRVAETVMRMPEPGIQRDSGQPTKTESLVRGRRETLQRKVPGGTSSLYVGRCSPDRT